MAAGGYAAALDAMLAMLQRVPCGRALLLAPLALAAPAALDSDWPPGGPWCRARADSAAAAQQPGAAAPASAAAAPDASGAAAGGLSAVLASLLGPNEFARGGLALMVVGAAAASARVALGSVLRYARRHVVVTAEIDSRDDAYRWVMFWLSQHPKFKHSTTVTVTTNLSCFGTAVAQQPLGGGAGAGAGSGEGPPVAYLPAPGDHLLRYRGHWVCISRRRSAGNPQLAANARLLLETLSISLLGTDRGPVDALLAEAAAAYSSSQSTRTIIHSVDPDGYWSQVGSRPIRPLSTVVLPKGQAEALLSDCREFLAAEAFYSRHGIPWRRGFLLYGPPGTGKTSLVMALAGALGLEIHVVTLSSPTVTDEGLRQLLNSAAPRSILLLEDVDAAFSSDRSAAGGAAARLTFSGLLNAVDGVAAQEGRLLFLTTNHIERLSEALIRPGRVDVRVFLGPATRQQAHNLFLSFYRDAQPLPPAQRQQDQERQGPGGATPGPPARPPPPSAEREAGLQRLAARFAEQLPERGGVSMAQLQGFLMLHRKDPAAAAAGVAAALLGGGGGGGGDGGDGGGSGGGS